MNRIARFIPQGNAVKERWVNARSLTLSWRTSVVPRHDEYYRSFFCCFGTRTLVDSVLIFGLAGVCFSPFIFCSNEEKDRESKKNQKREAPVGMALLTGSLRRLALLAPSSTAASTFFKRVESDARRSNDLLAELQRLRGSVYLKDGAIGPEDLSDGRHQADIDEESWHFVALDEADRVCGCIRYREYPRGSSFWQLGVSNSALARCDVWGPRLEMAVDAQLALSRQLNLPYIESGGWALSEHVRGTREALRMVIAVYGLSQVLGGAVGISTVTRRNGSASILKRIGGVPLQYQDAELPSYHDPRYNCEMELLGFRSWAPCSRFQILVDEMRTELRDIPVVTGVGCRRPWRTLARPPAPALPNLAEAALA